MCLLHTRAGLGRQREDSHMACGRWVAGAPAVHVLKQRASFNARDRDSGFWRKPVTSRRTLYLICSFGALLTPPLSDHSNKRDFAFILLQQQAKHASLSPPPSRRQRGVSAIWCGFLLRKMTNRRPGFLQVSVAVCTC